MVAPSPCPNENDNLDTILPKELLHFWTNISYKGTRLGDITVSTAPEISMYIPYPDEIS